MVDKSQEPVVVSANQSVIDLLMAAMRYVVVLVAAFPTILVLLQDHDITAIHAYFTSSDGKTVAAAAVALGTMLYGLYKTHKRGAQVATVASDERVPNAVAKLKT